MRSLTTFFVLLVVFTAPASLTYAQGTDPASKAAGSSSVSATKEEVNELRSEVAAQRKTIEELKALVEKLADGTARAAAVQPRTAARPTCSPWPTLPPSTMMQATATRIL